MGANGHPPPSSLAAQNGSYSGGGGGGGGGANPSNGSTAAALRHDPGLAGEWSPEEQATLDELLAKYASDAPVIRYAKIAMKLPEKTVRDVALRCRWMNKKESGKRKKEDHNSSKKSKDKKEKVSDSSSKPPVHMAGRPNVPPYPLPVLPLDDDEISSKAIGGPTGEILETNAQVLSQISTNLSNMQIQDNISLLCQTRDNILRILKDLCHFFYHGNASYAAIAIWQDKRCSRDHEADATATREDKRGACQLIAPQADCTYAVAIAKQMYPL
ncbi:homeobox protein SIX3-like isoform X2 [Panicum miliaceum]|uniref:Homeobox protein SIX3-like isoform X2 n=1 Tax=Panicum miliaceum TaxID=4540 RepID=A0A3L6QBV7_PANMI|nr:homeobox protein SIX3-like isoform X2 [Panicum miliaceum]